MTEELKQASQIDYDSILEKYPWIISKNQNYIVSPDSDGFLSALLLTNFLGGRVVGYYDGKISLIHKEVKASDCIFLDMEINRPNIKSIGHHMVTYNKRINCNNSHFLQSCIQPNIIRNFDGKNDFQSKYPFGTVHLLIGILHNAKLINSLTKNSIWPLLFTDGVWNNLFGYTENCIEWINYLDITNPDNPMNKLFCSNHYSFYEIMLGLNDFLRMRDNYNAKGFLNSQGQYQVGGRNKRTGDKLKITDSKGNIINLIKEKDLFSIHKEEKSRIEGFVVSMSEYVGWPYKQDVWSWENFRLLKFTKSDLSKDSLNNRTYCSLMDKNPLSLAMTSGINIEFTLETPDKLI